MYGYVSAHKPFSARNAALGALVFALALALTLPAGAHASMLTWGSSLGLTPTLSTAAGGAYTNAAGPASPILPNPHVAVDLGVWNTAVASGGAGAPEGGQVLEVKVEGCALEDASAPSQLSDTTPVNTVLFQALEPAANGAYTATATSGEFLMPFCGGAGANSTVVSNSTVTTFTPVHLCVSQGSAIAFHDIGGFIPAVNSEGPWYPQGVPFEVIARAEGSSMDSFVGVGLSTYGPGIWPPGLDHATSGFGLEPGYELDDAGR